MQEAILSVLDSKSNPEYSARELFKHLGYSRKVYDDYQEVLNQLLKIRKIEKVGKRKFRIANKREIVSGILRLTPHGYGFMDRNRNSSIFINAREASGALDGDWIKVELHDRGHEAGPEGHIVEIAAERRRNLLGRLLRIGGAWHAELKTGPLTFIARLRQNGGKSRADAFPKTVKSGDWAILQAPESRQRYPLPWTKIITVLGDPRRKGIAELGLLAEYGFRNDYPAKALGESTQLRPIPDRRGTRLDLTDEFVVTIDPADARDHDDAVSIRRDDSGGFHLSVHIADVGCYVRTDSAIDRAARERGFSVYLQHHHLPMLPPRLPGELCSLKPGRNRLTLSVLIHYDRKGRILSRRIVPAKIRVKRLISYEKAQEYLELKGKAGDNDPELKANLRMMWELAQILRENRLAEGGVDFDLPEAGFRWADEFAPALVFRQPRLSSHMLIEECMLAANRAVAEIWVQKLGEDAPLIFRVHPPPDAEKRRKLADFLADAGFVFPEDREDIIISQLSSARGIADLLDESRRRFPIEITSVIARKALTLARYDSHAGGHFGLGFQRYLHFTSPIRRYADLMVHRMVRKHLIDSEPYRPSEKTFGRHLALEEELQQICEYLSQRERLIAELERESYKLTGLLYLNERREEHFRALLVESYQDKLFVALRDLYLEGMLSSASNLRFRSRRNPTASGGSDHRIARRRRDRSDEIAIGEELTVKVADLDLFNRKLVLMPV
jgi:ribonuclease R